MQRQKSSSAASQRIDQVVSPALQDMYWIEENSTSIKAKNQAGKSILAFKKAQHHAERAITLQELKESQATESQVGNYTSRQRQQRFQGQES
jgi:hypothetical protein